MEMKMSENLGMFTSTTPVVMAFPSVTEARKAKVNGRETGEPKYGATFIFPEDHPDLKAFKEIAIGVARAKWPGRDLGADVKSGELKLPWAKGDMLADRRVAKLVKAGKSDDHKADFQRGQTVLKTSSKFAPALSVLENGKLVDLEGATIPLNKAKFYFGCECLVQVNFVAYDRVGDAGKDGVTAYLQMVVSLNKGKKLAGAKSAAETFSGYVGKASEENPLGDAADDEF
jgi:Protein of unknown function (DUF2815)